MTLAFWMILVAAVLPYLTVFYAKLHPHFDNHSPRVFLENQKGRKKRAYWAHLNSFEIFPLFAAAVIIAHIAGAEQLKIDMLAFGFVGSRIGYILAYICDHANLRSLLWAIGFSCIVSLFIIAA